MSKINFTCDFKSSELQSLLVPVEVRKSNLTLVAQTLTSQPVNLDPGTYHATARLPAGQEFYAQVTVEGKDDTFILKPDPEDVSPNESLEVQRYIIGQQTTPVAGAEEIEGLGAENVVAKLRAFRGNILQGSLLAMDPLGWFVPLPAPAPGVAKFNCRGGDIKLVQLLQPKAPPINVVLPVSPSRRDWPSRGCQLILTRLSNGLCSVDVRLENIDADALLRYHERGLLEQAATAATSKDLQDDEEAMKAQDVPANAQELLAEKVRDPVAATVGAYTLLRFGDLERLHHWTRNLRYWFEWLPDGIPIRAEHLARLAEHDQALLTLLDLPSRGLPIFSDGLSYAIDRLRLYISLDGMDFPIEYLAEAKSILDKLRRFTAFVDFRKSILTYTGIDPSNPNAEPLGEAIEDYDGVDIGQYMG